MESRKKPLPMDESSEMTQKQTAAVSPGPRSSTGRSPGALNWMKHTALPTRYTALTITKNSVFVSVISRYPRWITSGRSKKAAHRYSLSSHNSALRRRSSCSVLAGVVIIFFSEFCLKVHFMGL